MVCKTDRTWTSSNNTWPQLFLQVARTFQPILIAPLPQSGRQSLFNAHDSMTQRDFLTYRCFRKTRCISESFCACPLSNRNAKHIFEWILLLLRYNGIGSSNAILCSTRKTCSTPVISSSSDVLQYVYWSRQPSASREVVGPYTRDVQLPHNGPAQILVLNSNCVNSENAKSQDSQFPCPLAILSDIKIWEDRNPHHRSVSHH